MTSEPRCSFCKRPKSAVRKLIEGMKATICNLCIQQANGPFATIAACSQCEPVNGKHAIRCPERGRCA